MQATVKARGDGLYPHQRRDLAHAERSAEGERLRAEREADKVAARSDRATRRGRNERRAKIRAELGGRKWLCKFCDGPHGSRFCPDRTYVPLVTRSRSEQAAQACRDECLTQRESAAKFGSEIHGSEAPARQQITGHTGHVARTDMGDETKISWCDHTFNVWWGCSRVSPGCDNCYAESFDHRLGGEHWGPTAPRRFFGDAYWRKPVAWNAAAQKAGVRASVFCSSMADWAEVHQMPEVREQQREARNRLWKLIRGTPQLDWLMLSKRPENFGELLPWTLDKRYDHVAINRLGTPEQIRQALIPYPNVTLMVTGENTEQLLRRTAILRSTPAARRAISAEPLLEHIPASAWDEALPGIDRLIVGDESGHGRRPAQLDWVRTARDAAGRHGVAFHLKQLHVNGKVVHLPVLDGRTHSA